jgi:hypothetical protein
MYGMGPRCNPRRPLPSDFDGVCLMNKLIIKTWLCFSWASLSLSHTHSIGYINSFERTTLFSPYTEWHWAYPFIGFSYYTFVCRSHPWLIPMHRYICGGSLVIFRHIMAKPIPTHIHYCYTTKVGGEKGIYIYLMMLDVLKVINSIAHRSLRESRPTASKGSRLNFD